MSARAEEWIKFVVAFVLAGMVGYFAMVNTVNARIAVLEAKQQDTGESLRRIESKVDRLLELKR